jgi:hypothetical protein
MFNWRSKNAILEVKSSILAAFLTTFKSKLSATSYTFSTGQWNLGGDLMDLVVEVAILRPNV